MGKIISGTHDFVKAGGKINQNTPKKKWKGIGKKTPKNSEGTPFLKGRGTSLLSDTGRMGSSHH